MDQPTQRGWHAFPTAAADGHSRLPGKVLPDISRAGRHGIATTPTARLSSRQDLPHSTAFPNALYVDQRDITNPDSVRAVSTMGS